MELIKSEQIRAGLQKSVQRGTSAKASSVCYRYKTTRTGELVIDPIEANIVLFIFRCFMNDDSLGKISDALARMDIVSPTGKDTWSHETISKLLLNEKYVDDVVLGKAYIIEGIQVKSHDASKQVLMRAHHPASISHEFFNAVQQEKRKRSKSQTVSR